MLGITAEEVNYRVAELVKSSLYLTSSPNFPSFQSLYTTSTTTATTMMTATTTTTTSVTGTFFYHHYHSQFYYCYSCCCLCVSELLSGYPGGLVGGQ